LLDRQKLDEILSVEAMTRPGIAGTERAGRAGKAGQAERGDQGERGGKS
jgi:hypothetical protein